MRDEFLIAACVPRSAHASGTLDAADALLAAHPEVAGADIYTAAVRGEPEHVRALLADDPGPRRRARRPVRVGRPHLSVLLAVPPTPRFRRVRRGGRGAA